MEACKTVRLEDILPVVYNPAEVERYKAEHPDGDIMVSVLCLVYNHEKYLRKCLDGFVMQKTDFPFEILVHEDASTDSSADILREYEAKYPSLFHVVYQKENQYSQHKPITANLYKRARGKYIAFCEGDDYWCDEYKLQTQVDFLRKHPEVHMCAHKTACCNEDGDSLKKSYPGFPLQTQIFSSIDFLDRFSKSHFVHVCSYMIDAAYIRVYYPPKDEEKRTIPSPFGDASCAMLYAGFGHIGYLNEVMSVHRMGSAEGWSVRFNNASANEIKSRKTNNIHMAEELDAFFAYKYHKEYEAWCYSKVCFIADATGDYSVFQNKKNKERLRLYGSRNQRIRYGLCAAFPYFFPRVFRWYFMKKGIQLGKIATE